MAHRQPVQRRKKCQPKRQDWPDMGNSSGSFAIRDPSRLTATFVLIKHVNGCPCDSHHHFVDSPST
jgi:hypothetical protein